MKLKHIIILSLVFIGLIVLVSLKKFFIKPEIEITEYEQLEFSIDTGGIYSFQIQKPGDEEITEFKKRDEVWFIPSNWDAKANKEKMENFLKDLGSLEGELRSGSKELLSDYGITDDEAYSFSFYDKEEKLKERLFIGIKKPGYGKSFVRKDGSSEVYLADKDVFSMLGIYGDPKDADFNIRNWIDLSIINLDVEKVDSLKIERTEEDKKIATVDVKRDLDEEKNMKRWITDRKEAVFPLDASKIRDFLKRLNAISANDIVDPNEKDYGFTSPYLTLSIKEEKSFLELIVGNPVSEDTKERYVKTPDGYVYILREYQMRDIDIDVSRFFVANPLKIDKEKLREITINSPGKSVTLDESLIAKNTDYIDKLKDFSVDRISFGEKAKEVLKDPADYFLNITTKEGESFIIEAGKEGDEKYIARLKTNPTVFFVKKNSFEDIFEKLDNLDLEIETTAEIKEEEKEEQQEIQ